MTKHEKEVKEILVESINKLEFDAIKLTDTLEDLGADSLDTVELVMLLEDEFNIEIPDDVASELYTVGDVYNYLKNNT